jgi:hypothetical protein
MGKILTSTDLFLSHARHTGQHGLLLSWTPADVHNVSIESAMEEIARAAPILEGVELITLIAERELYRYYDSEEACYEDFCRIVGDDGPTDLNDYDGPERVYALTCDNKGNFRCENT